MFICVCIIEHSFVYGKRNHHQNFMLFFYMQKGTLFQGCPAYLECLGGESRNQVFQMYWIAPVYDISAI